MGIFSKPSALDKFFEITGIAFTADAKINSTKYHLCFDKKRTSDLCLSSRC